MKISEAMALIRNPTLQQNRIHCWCDLGCGTGAFTMGLAQSLTSGTIHVVDLDSKALGTIPDEDHGVVIRKVLADLRSPGLRLPSVDGILMANSLHFIQDQHLFIKKLLPLTNSFFNCGVRTIKPKSLGTLSGRLRKAPRTLQRIRSAAGREAIAELQKSIQLSGDSPIFTANLARAYVATNRKAEAVELF
jgi:ubiquinone/menaquinone biosynthesis C-methylase UbiE